MNVDAIRAGKQILDIITSGMYSNALMILREYVQNSADSIDNAVSKGLIDYSASRIDISIDGENRILSVLDNGAGIQVPDIHRISSSIAISSKSTGSWRGFRGIGRLGGIGYCDEVVFETRSTKSEPVSIARWDSKVLRNECRNTSNEDGDLIEVVQKIVKVSKRPANSDDPHHFFKVTLSNVHRFHRDDLMNSTLLSEYLSQVAPVPFQKSVFAFAREIDKYLAGLDGYRTYNIFLNGNKIFKPHQNEFATSGQSNDLIKSVQVFTIKGRNSQCIGRGWFAQTSYRASLTQSEKMRGIRVKQGNIEVGDEYFLADSFTERRFSTWHIGEIHFNYTMRLNARRDGFEQSPDYEAFMEQCSLLCKHLSGLCRNASKTRSQSIEVQRSISEAEAAIDKAMILKNNSRDEEITKVKAMIDRIQKSSIEHSNGHREKVSIIQNKLSKIDIDKLSLSDILDGRILRGIDQKELIEDIAERILHQFDGCISSMELIKRLIAPYMKKEAVF